MTLLSWILTSESPNHPSALFSDPYEDAGECREKRAHGRVSISYKHLGKASRLKKGICVMWWVFHCFIH